MISALHALAHLAPDLLDELPEKDLALLTQMPELSLRPEQQLPRGPWRSFGFLTGRGWGKTHAIANEIHRRVRDGELRAIALVAPTVDRVGEVQVPALTETACAECPCEPYGGGVLWANGTVAEATSSMVPRPSSGSNYELTWMTEIVRWNTSTRMSAFHDITTATRAGRRPQYLWDTTSSGRNDVIEFLLEQHARDPAAHRIVRGTMFDNPLLSRAYIIDEIAKYVPGTRRYAEEVLGETFKETPGALWQEAWISDNRVISWPIKPGLVVLGCDPALSGDSSADEVGLAKGALVGEDVFLRDLSSRMSPEEYATRIVDECQRDASGVVLERNHVGQHARDLIGTHAKLRGMRVELLPNPERPFPPRTPGVVHIREIVSRSAKEVRAGPIAALYHAGRVHHVGHYARLEHEQTTWEPGGRSPNRMDAAVFAVGELAGVWRRVKPSPQQAVAQASQAAERLRLRQREYTRTHERAGRRSYM